MSNTTFDVHNIFIRRWVCEVNRSGYHNGVHCSVDNAHDNDLWGCGYRWVAPPLTDDEASLFGIPRD